MWFSSFEMINCQKYIIIKNILHNKKKTFSFFFYIKNWNFLIIIFFFTLTQINKIKINKKKLFRNLFKNDIFLKIILIFLKKTYNL